MKAYTVSTRAWVVITQDVLADDEDQAIQSFDVRHIRNVANGIEAEYGSTVAMMTDGVDYDAIEVEVKRA